MTLASSRIFPLLIPKLITSKRGINPFPHTTILQQTTLNIFCQNIENLYNWMDNPWLKVEYIVAKGEIARFEQFLLLSLFSNSRLLQRRQKASIWGKGLRNKCVLVYFFIRDCALDMSTCMVHIFNWTTCRQSFKPFPHISDASAGNGFSKTWQQKKILVKTSNFSFYHHVFNSIQLLSLKGRFQFFSGMFSKSSASDLLYVGKG